jgi:hypothetical protein
MYRLYTDYRHIYVPGIGLDITVNYLMVVSEEDIQTVLESLARHGYTTDVVKTVTWLEPDAQWFGPPSKTRPPVMYYVDWHSLDEEHRGKVDATDLSPLKPLVLDKADLENLLGKPIDSLQWEYPCIMLDRALNVSLTIPYLDLFAPIGNIRERVPVGNRRNRAGKTIAVTS